MLSPQTRVGLTGLSRKPELNFKTARVVGEFDGQRYPIQLDRDRSSHILVRPENLVPLEIGPFLKLTQRLTEEVNFFTSTLTLNKKNACFIPLCPFIRSTTVALEVGSGGEHICCYAPNEETPCAIAFPCTELVIGAKCEDFYVPEIDTPIKFSVEDQRRLSSCDVIRICHPDGVHLFPNHVPAYHMSMRKLYHYHEYACSAVHVNYLEMQHFNTTTPIPESIRYDAFKQVLMYRVHDDEKLHRVLSPLRWDAGVFHLVQSLVTLTPYRLLSLPRASRDVAVQLPDPPAVSVIPGCRVLVKSRTGITGIESFSHGIVESFSHFTDKDVVTLKDGRVESTINVTIDETSYLLTEFVYAKMWVEFCTKRIRSFHLAHAHDIIHAILLRIKTCDSAFAAHGRDLLRLNGKTRPPSDAIADLVCESLSDEDTVIAWVANAEALMTALNWKLDDPCTEIVMCDGAITIVKSGSRSVHIASFDDDPLIGQTRIAMAQELLLRRYVSQKPVDAKQGVLQKNEETTSSDKETTTSDTEAVFKKGKKNRGSKGSKGGSKGRRSKRVKSPTTTETVTKQAERVAKKAAAEHAREIALREAREQAARDAEAEAEQVAREAEAEAEAEAKAEAEAEQAAKKAEAERVVREAAKEIAEQAARQAELKRLVREAEAERLARIAAAEHAKEIAAKEAEAEKIAQAAAEAEKIEKIAQAAAEAEKKIAQAAAEAEKIEKIAQAEAEKIAEAKKIAEAEKIAKEIAKKIAEAEAEKIASEKAEAVAKKMDKIAREEATNKKKHYGNQETIKMSMVSTSVHAKEAAKEAASEAVNSSQEARRAANAAAVAASHATAAANAAVAAAAAVRPVDPSSPAELDPTERLRQELHAMQRDHQALKEQLDVSIQKEEEVVAAILVKLTEQLRFYMRGHYMKLDSNTLSVPAVLSDGHVIRTMLAIFKHYKPDMDEADVIHLAVHKTADLISVGNTIVRK